MKLLKELVDSDRPAGWEIYMNLVGHNSRGEIDTNMDDVTW